jgi:hypothetical protein
MSAKIYNGVTSRKLTKKRVIFLTISTTVENV